MKILRGLLTFLFSGVFILINPFAWAEQEAETTHAPSAHEMVYPVVHASEEKVVFEESLNDLYHNAFVKKKLDFRKLAESMGATVLETDKTHAGYAIIERENVTITMLYEVDGNLIAFFTNDYGRLVELQTLFANEKDLARIVYYFATRAVIDLRELAEHEITGYLPVETMYRVTVFEGLEPDEHGMYDYGNLPTNGHVDFYNLH